MNNMPPKETQPTKIQKILNERGLSKRDLGKLIEEANDGNGITQYLLTEIVNGKRKSYTTTTLKLICNALNVTPNDIIE